MGIQRVFENGKDKRGHPVPVDMDKVCREHDWIKAYVRTEGAVYAFSDPKTAAEFAGDVGTVTMAKR
jgi:hypothetical protein